MALFSQELAEMRFGCGLGMGAEPPADVAQMLARLRGPDHAARAHPVPTFEEVRKRLLDGGRIGRAARRGSEAARQAANDELKREMRMEQAGWFRATLARRLDARDGFRERLVAFWADHFTAVGKQNILRSMHAPYVQGAIRPHVTGRFADMLKAVIRHPLMLSYLDQLQSAGPNSRAAQRSDRVGGLNENLARELLELHTLGVGGAYDQRDVTELAQLLTGLSYDAEKGFVFRGALAEPGSEVVLGKSYGSRRPDLAAIDAALENLAIHPDTGAHLARKLAVHFIGDAPAPRMVAEMQAAYAASGGQMMALYQAMLKAPEAWAVAPGNVKQPIDFVASSLRALGVRGRDLGRFRPRDLRNGIALPMALMGQAWEQPLGPDGWPEADGDWVTPQRLAARLQWAMTVPVLIVPRLPDPREFVITALGARADETVRFAARAAESRAEGVGLVLSSARFQRM